MAFNFQFQKPHTVVKKRNGGWTLEVNNISWNGGDPKYDIRAWSPDHEAMSKGLSLTKEDLIALRDALISMKIE